MTTITHSCPTCGSTDTTERSVDGSAPSAAAQGAVQLIQYHCNNCETEFGALNEEKK